MSCPKKVQVVSTDAVAVAWAFTEFAQSITWARCEYPARAMAIKMTREMIFPMMEETTFIRIKPTTIEAAERPKAMFMRVSMSADDHKEFIPSP